MPSARFTHSADAARPSAVVWERLQAVETWANIGPIDDVWDPVHEDGELRGYRWSATVGPTKYKGTARVVETIAPVRMRLELDAREMAGELEAVIAENGDGATRITVTLEVESRGMLSTLFFPVVSEAVGNGLPAQVDGFAASLEAD